MTVLGKTNSEKELETSCLISYQVSRVGEDYDIPETLIKLCTIDIFSGQLDEKAIHSATNISLSNNIIIRRVGDIAADVKKTYQSPQMY